MDGTSAHGRYVLVGPGAERDGADEFKRYLPAVFTFDTRHHLLEEISDDWEPNVREQAVRNRQLVINELAYRHGADNLDEKISNLRDLGRGAWSVVVEHTVHLQQVRDTFIATCYYPALLGACGLGERILNQLVLGLRENYVGHPATAKVEKKESFQNWHVPIVALLGWGILDERAAANFERLAVLRNNCVHYGPTLDKSDGRIEALEAIVLLRDLVEDLFQPFASDSRFFTGPIGRGYIRRDAENDPFIRRYFLPACDLVSPVFEFRPNEARNNLDVWDIVDWAGPSSLTDEQFASWMPDVAAKDLKSESGRLSTKSDLK